LTAKYNRTRDRASAVDKTRAKVGWPEPASSAKPNDMQ